MLNFSSFRKLVKSGTPFLNRKEYEKIYNIYLFSPYGLVHAEHKYKELIQNKIFNITKNACIISKNVIIKNKHNGLLITDFINDKKVVFFLYYD